jgi:hypothetical protein
MNANRPALPPPLAVANRPSAWVLPPNPGPAWATPTHLDLSLNMFEPIGLNEMAAVALLDRIDTKYVLDRATLLAVLPALAQHYRVLEVAGARQSPYETLYFDTADFALYHWHQAGRRVRYKVRSREYTHTGQAFFELKCKTGASHTHKQRLATPAMATRLTADLCRFLAGRLPLPASTLAPRLWVTFNRITLVSRTDAERLTLDLDLRFDADGRSVALPGLVAAEVKHVGRPRASAFIQLMRLEHLRPCGFSKYCIGASLLYPALKHSRFSPALRRVEPYVQGVR